MEGHQIRELERELGMCVDELTMLGASGVRVAVLPDYTMVLTKVTEKMVRLKSDVESGNWVSVSTKSFVVMLYVLIHETWEKLYMLDLSKDTTWLSVLNRLKLINNTARVFTYGVKGEMQTICGALASATTVSDEKGFKDIRRASLRNKKALEVLTDIGNRLSDLINDRPTFYAFLGPAGEKTMKEIIQILISVP